ncbi:MAG: hypothetical protein KME49_19545 [Brasilonema octagenarum HA4186-MV1]|nr:hypothetical protein [Brasilonema octagenarum HA4186-MV1]
MAIAYAISYRTVGRQAAQRRLGSMLPAFFVGFGLSFLNRHGFLGKYGSISFYFICSAYVVLWLLTWNWRKRKAGALLLDAGQLSRSKLILWVGVLVPLFAVFDTWSAINKISTGLGNDTELVEEISRLVLLWSSAIYFLSMGLSRLEFRENGICYGLSMVKWEKLISYSWSQEKPNILMISFKQLHYRFLTGFWSLRIPSAHRDAVKQILAEHLIMTDVK